MILIFHWKYAAGSRRQVKTGELTEQLFECFTEPDLSFYLDPKSEYNDIYVTICVALRKAGTSCYTAAELQIKLEREDIRRMCCYLQEVMNV